MLATSPAFSGFSTNDIESAKAFYGETLGLPVTVNAMGILDITLGSGGHVIVYPKPDHEPATFTVLNFEVDDIDAIADALVEKGVELLRYDGMPQDEKGIGRGKAAGMGPDIAWFTDPGGNILSILSN